MKTEKVCANIWLILALFVTSIVAQDNETKVDEALEIGKFKSVLIVKQVNFMKEIINESSFKNVQTFENNKLPSNDITFHSLVFTFLIIHFDRNSPRFTSYSPRIQSEEFYIGCR